MTDDRPYRHRFPLTIIQHAVWLYHRFALSDRDVQEVLHQRGIQVSHETLREWCIKFATLFTEDLRQREPRRGSRWPLDEHGFVLDILLQRHRDTDAAKISLTRLPGGYDVPEVIHTDGLRSDGAASRALPSLANVDHQQVISTARCNNLVEHSHRPTRRQERSQQGFKRRKRAQEFLSLHARIENLHHHSRASISAHTRRNHQKRASQT